jgi:hypothetical protein
MAKADSILLSSRASAALLMAYGRRSALSCALHAGGKVLFCSASDAWFLTELSNVVAYACRYSRAEDSASWALSIFVILSEAKDLIAVVTGMRERDPAEIGFPQLGSRRRAGGLVTATNISAINISGTWAA